jgi:hypothetical protein
MTDDDDPITLDDAIKLFPGARLTVSTLRAERCRSFGAGGEWTAAAESM